MELGNGNVRFGVYWLAFGYTLALHVLDEAGHNFLAVYNPNALAIRRALPFLPVPLFSYEECIGRLLLGLTLWLTLAPLAFHRLRWLRWLAVPAAILLGIGNGLFHIISSIYVGHALPGVYSALLIALAGILLLRSAVAKQPQARSAGTSA